ncbi:hypothetical protein [uncultured Ruminococcus sp.]|uniref:hypothetical protein n=1 Tax=uncultured Ruminococcus sp. TaxID=165186 RepID=UPI0025CC4DD9|nr:hypothetical protein [uncultured Ruminococcus sp.]
MSTRTKRISVRVPNDIYDDIETKAEQKGIIFSKEVVKRLRNQGDTPLPAVLAKTQNIINLTRAGKTEEAQKEMNLLWQKTLTFSK